MFKIFLFVTLISSEICADFQRDEEIISKHGHKRSLGDGESMIKRPFIDVTEAINQQDILKIEKTLNVTSRLHYSTSKLFKTKV